MQLSISTIFMVIFFCNTWLAIRFICFKHKNATSWCCFLQVLMGLITEITCILSILAGVVSCRWIMWISSFGVVVSSNCISVCLLLQAYAITERNCIISVLGALFMIPLSGMTWIVLCGPKKITVESGCISKLSGYFPWFHFISDIIINFIFSTIFLHVIIKQYCTFGDDCWKQL